jgi:hypothetical protein
MFVQRSPSRKSTGPRRIAGLAVPRLVGYALSLGVATSTLSSCIVDEPPDFEDRQRTAPTLYLANAVPSSTTIVPVTSGQTNQFTVKLESEDLGEDLVAIPWVNYGLENAKALALHSIPHGHLGAPRDVSFPVTIDPSGPKGCVPLTIFFVHFDDVQFTDNDGARPKPGVPFTFNTWFLLVDEDPQDVTFADCPQPATTPSQ